MIDREFGAGLEQFDGERAVIAGQVDEDLVIERRHGVTLGLRHEVGERVDLAERGGLQQAAGVEVVLAEEVGDGAGDLAQPVDAAAVKALVALDEIGGRALWLTTS